jgi:RNA polymerase sigma-70 factor (ECF subfamily)
MEKTDAQLLEGLERRDEAALRLVIDRYGSVVYGAARWLVKDEGIAEEVAQDTFVTLWKKPEAVNLSKGSLKSFLTGVARHKAIDRIRSAEAYARNTGGPEMTMPPAAVDVTETIVERDALIEALNRLTEVQREALVLAYLGGRTYREVAHELDIPEGTAKTRLRDGLTALRRCMAPLEAATA